MRALKVIMHVVYAVSGVVKCTTRIKFIYIFYLHTFKNSGVGKCCTLASS